MKINRDYLIPYLNDICSLHLAVKKLEKLEAGCWHESRRIRANAEESVPVPKLESVSNNGTGGCAFNCLGGLVAFMAFPLFFASLGADSPWMLLLPLGVAIAGVLIVQFGKNMDFHETYELQKRNEKKQLQYQQQVEVAKLSVEEDVQRLREKELFYKDEIDRVNGILESIYGLNIIPRTYRNIYAAFYLRDWFATGISDDLDMALNTFVLEEIKERLDRIISNQEMMILNQRIMIANQNKSIEQQERHNQVLRSKLDRIQASNEERNMYLGMIEANTRADAFFSAATYLKS